MNAVGSAVVLGSITFMKTLPLLLSCLSLLLASCASTIQSRVTHNPELFGKLSAADQQAVRAGQVREGMTKEAVFLAWGSPDRVSQGQREGKQVERWNYTELQTVFAPAIGFGYGGFGRCGIYDRFYYGGPTFASVPVPGRAVEFLNGKVSGFMLPR